MTRRQAFKVMEAVARAHANGTTFGQVQRIEQALNILRPLVNDRSQPASQPKAGPPRPSEPTSPTTPAQQNQLDLL